MRAAMSALAVLVACGGRLSQTEVEHRRTTADARTQASLADSRDRYLSEHHLSLKTPVSLAPYPSPYRADAPDNPRVVVEHGAGLEPGESIIEVVADDGSHTLALSTPSRCGCGCDTSVQYAVGQASDGSVTVLRLTAKDHVEHVKQRGGCSFGCGAPPEPMPPDAIGLPVTDPARVRVEATTFDRYLVDATCEHQRAAP